MQQTYTKDPPESQPSHEAWQVLPSNYAEQARNICVKKKWDRVTRVKNQLMYFKFQKILLNTSSLINNSQGSLFAFSSHHHLIQRHSEITVLFIFKMPNHKSVRIFFFCSCHHFIIFSVLFFKMYLLLLQKCSHCTILMFRLLLGLKACKTHG